MGRKAKVLRIGVASLDQIRDRTLAIARGEYRRRPDDPRVWFTSLESLAQVLSSRNRALLETIRRRRPASMGELAKMSGRAESNLSRTLRTMARYGLVHLKKTKSGRIVPEVPYDRLALDVRLTAPEAA